MIKHLLPLIQAKPTMVGRSEHFSLLLLLCEVTFAPNSGLSEPDNDLKLPIARSGSFQSV